ncbi:MAG: tripartite tricarboxylate transporter substrate binding protein [Reyranella sp.]|uniref:Bug family tripartite tricarboxylate transporter substrate binding protein n=1 Tax=Reyranella sp. TaxID=1929291 RepID=UPI0011F84DE9|nr:tripartite tricarboxylate transporter substrate-binding protein [Reyranella sp.]TAJ35666.1 MAG: tripartite tricarboxylate transporter substrate binding protein [Reyranella sp.]
MTLLVHRRAVLATAFAAGAAGALAVPLRAGRADSQAFLRADRTARIVVPFAAGGTTDLLGRLMAGILAARLGEPFTIENRAGAAGIASAEIVARAPPDGRTLLLGTVSTAVTNQYLYRHLPYDGVESFAPVALMAEMANVLVVHPDFPARTLQEFVGLCRAAGPHKVAYGSSGVGSAGHLAMEYLQCEAGIRLAHAAQRGRARMTRELLSGQLMVAMDTLPACLKHIRSGALRALAVSSAERWFAAPEIPTVAEQGFADFDATLWWYAAVPAGTRRDRVKTLSEAIVAGLKSPAATARLRGLGVRERPGTAEDLFLHIAAENVKWKKVIASAGLAPR